MEDTEKVTEPNAQPAKQLAHHVTVEQAYEAIQSAIIEAAQSGAFMVAVWSFDRSDNSDKVRLVTRTTWRFPVNEYVTASELLRADTNKDAARISDALRPGPLELASLVSRARAEAQATQAIQQADDHLIPTDDTHAH